MIIIEVDYEEVFYHTRVIIVPVPAGNGIHTVWNNDVQYYHDGLNIYQAKFINQERGCEKGGDSFKITVKREPE